MVFMAVKLRLRRPDKRSALVPYGYPAIAWWMRFAYPPYAH
jgi:hypothetical protein